MENYTLITGATGGLGKSFVKASSSLQNIFSDLSSALYSNKEHNLNANLLEKYGENALLRGAEAERNYRLSEKMILGKQKNILAQNGVDLSSKTAIDILTQTERNIENDALQIRANAQEEKRMSLIRRADVLKKRHGVWTKTSARFN